MLYVGVAHDSSLLCCPPEDVVLPEKPKLKFVNKVPNFKKAKKEMKKLRDIQGPAKAANTFTTGQYAIVVSAFILLKQLLEALKSMNIVFLAVFHKLMLNTL